LPRKAGPSRVSLPGGFVVVMPRATLLNDTQWCQFDYRGFVTCGDDSANENFDLMAGAWRQGDDGQPLYGRHLWKCGE
jgi:hypothetical protein